MTQSFSHPPHFFNEMNMFDISPVNAGMQNTKTVLMKQYRCSSCQIVMYAPNKMLKCLTRMHRGLGDFLISFGGFYNS